MALIDYYKRRCGNTTRQVDEWIQDLFAGKEVIIADHAHKDGNYANDNAKNVFLKRLEFEHGLKLGRSSPLIFEEGAYKLLPF